MDTIDKEKTSFITDRGTYCYKVLPAKMFQEHLGNTMEVYIDDMLVKTQHSGDHISHVSDAFQILRKFNMKLNLEKCAFGIASGTQKFEDILIKSTTARKIKGWGKTAHLHCHLRSSGKCCFSPRGPSQEVQLEAEKELQVLNGANPGIWTLFVDGSSNIKGAGLGIVLVPPTGETIRQAIKSHSIINNEAEYEAVIAGLELARELHINQIVIKSDSQLVVALIARDKNVEADALANLASAADVASNENASVIHLFHSVIDPDKNENGIVPEDKRKAHALRKKAARYCLKQGNLYRKMFGGPLARCLGPSHTEYVMREIHEGHCGNHAGGRSLSRSFNSNRDKRAKYKIYTSVRRVNNEEMRINLDLLEGKREAALIRMTAQKQVIERYYNRKARLRFFKIGDFMLKKVFQSMKAANAGKLSPTWEGPYRIHDITAKGAYELETMDGKILPSHWNVVHLKRYYF
ncbi:uncharacterized protein [Nicotiana sylvestris]|uniref:uncharacterized protein n=1 Tax=Nicotiana sylvestris TaxID=4096 RepID=UPI00388C95C0